MKPNFSAIFSGLALILAGGIALAAQMGYLDNRSPQFWMAAFGGFALLFLLAYLVSGVRAWGWLFPSLISAALALTIFLAESVYHHAAIGSPILLAIGLPFIGAYAIDRSRNWWALIPAWVMGALALVTMLADRVPGEFIAMIVLLAFALPFLAVFLMDRSRWWALIPAFLFGFIAFIPLLAANLKGEYVGGFINIILGLPFIVAYLVSRKSWWALIPGGVMASIGLMIILMGIFGDNHRTGALVTTVMFLGWAATFGVLWLLRDRHPTDWAKYPAIALAGVAGILFLVAAGFEVYWPLLLIAAGIILLALNFGSKVGNAG